MYKKLKKIPITEVDIMSINPKARRKTEEEIHKFPSRKNLVKNSTPESRAASISIQLSAFLDLNLDIIVSPTTIIALRQR